MDALALASADTLVTLLIGAALGGGASLCITVWAFARALALREPEAWDLVIGPITVQKGERMSQVQRLTTEEQTRLTLQLTTRKGKPARIDGLPIFLSSNPDVLTVAALEGDPFTAVAKAVSPGQAAVSVSADADLGEGVRTVIGTIAFEVVWPEAAALTIHAGPAEEQPDPVPAPEPAPAEAPAET